MSTAEKLKREGRAEGHAEGRAEGEAKRHAEIILRLLTQRFGALSTENTERVHGANLTELDIWTDRIFDAKSLADVFAAD